MLKRSRLALGELAAVMSMLLALSSVTLGSGPDVIVDNSLSTSDPMATPPEYKTWLEMIDEETLNRRDAGSRHWYRYALHRTVPAIEVWSAAGHRRR